MQSEDYFGDWRDFLNCINSSRLISKATGRGRGSLLLMHFRKQLLISSGCTFLKLCFCRCHLYYWSNGLFNGFELGFMQPSAYWVLENSEWHKALALPCINFFHLLYWNSGGYGKMGLTSITWAEKGMTNFNVISLKIAKVISCTIQLWAKQAIVWLNCYSSLVLKSFLTPVCQRKKKSGAFTDIGLPPIDSWRRGALCETNREKTSVKSDFQFEETISGKKKSQSHSQQEQPVPGSLTNICLYCLTSCLAWVSQIH